MAFATPLPSLAPMDLLIGIVGAVVIRLAVYVKGKNAKKYRKGMEYGSARWGNAEDIKPYIDPIFENNVLLTQTERLMMSSRPKHPKYARNKNVLVIGGSGSGKTTLLRCLNFLETPDAGTITVQDKVLFDADHHANCSEKEIRKNRLHFGMVFQSFNLFPQYTALENVTLARELMAKDSGESKEAIRAAGMELLDQMGLCLLYTSPSPRDTR